MDYIDKLFNQHPFIYYIKGKYYAFGVNVCAECGGNSVFLESRYKAYEESIKNDVTDKEAWKIFCKLSLEASGAETKSIVHTKEEFAKLNFSEDDIKELAKQIERYRNYWREHHLKDQIR
ncbi:MAG: hypothetical protein U0I41_01955 [Coprococcus sp.]|nr:hypothetical protein [Coprococcus sp.]